MNFFVDFSIGRDDLEHSPLESKVWMKNQREQWYSFKNQFNNII